MKVQAILPTAGLGERLKTKIPKPLISLQGKPVFVYSLTALEQSSLIDSMVLVVHSQYIPAFKTEVQKFHLRKVKKIISGGKTRADSVKKGLEALDKDTDIVLVHDGVRPFLTTKLIEEGIRLCKEAGAVVAAVPVKPTIKKIDPVRLIVEETLPRDILWEAQTPQIFKRDLLEKAFAENDGKRTTDDASLVEQLGVKVKIFMGDYKNIKITTPEDLMIAEAFLKHGI